MNIDISGFLFALSTALDCVEHDLLGATTNHSKRAAYLSMELCKALGLPEQDVFDMACCAVLHDNALTAYLMEVGVARATHLEHIKIHCKVGEDKTRNFPFLGNTNGVILHHHENWDGSGYHGLTGMQIPLRASALHLADTVDVIFALGGEHTQQRSARQSGDILEIVRTHVLQKREVMYDPNLVDIFLNMWNTDLLARLDDNCIDSTLALSVPHVARPLTTAQTLAACALFADIIDAKSPFTRHHSKGIAEKTSRMAHYLGVNEEQRNLLVMAAELHDVGKLTVPNQLLEKNGKLEEAEFMAVKRHVSVTESILSKVKGFEQVTKWASSHHEKLDGSGYPHGYRAEELPFESRLLTCVDIYQALTEERPYRASMSHSKAITILESMAKHGKVDASIVEAMNVALVSGQWQATPGNTSPDAVVF